MSNLLCVFTANPEITNDVIDVGCDPNFSEPFFTWGICRPDKRYTIKKGDYLFFLGKVIKPRKYIFKGFFQVGEILNYNEALLRFPNRQNVIITKNKSDINRIIKWRYQEKENKCKEVFGNIIPEFLFNIKTTKGVYYQNPQDDHEIDNWKCNRIFRCNKNQFCNCIDNKKCLKEDRFFNMKGYIVSSEIKIDVGDKGITWDDVCPKDLINVPLKVGKGKNTKHNPINLTDGQANEIIMNLKKHIK